jgi:hypothetical protein
MPVKQRSSLRQVVAGLVLVVVLAVVVIATRTSGSPRPPSPIRAAAPARAIGSMFQDDDHLIYAPTSTVRTTLDRLKGLGVNQIRATIVWKAIAPDAASTVAPRGFDATNPADYPAALWAPYDRLVRLAADRGLAVNFNVTAPAPLWAVSRGAPSSRYADHWAPASADFGRFVQALGRRYDGRYVPAGGSAPLPRVSFWSVWNEPNQPGWLAPQWRLRGGTAVMEAPVLYRAYVDSAFAALARTSHTPATDAILVGDLAPEGCVAGVRCIYPRQEWPIPPLPFLRALYCVDSAYHPLSGSAAALLGCPSTPSPRAFVSAHPGLFRPTGFAHHPYSFFLAPDAPMANPDFAPLANLARLEHGLDSIFRTYGVARRLPLYLTEYGYETNPPNPYRGVSPQRQAAYLSQAEYMAWADPRVVTLSQFLLYDSPPNRRFPRGSPGYWSTFQTGLLYANGAVKPSFDSYRLPLWLPHPVLGPGHRLLVWAMLRAAPRHGQQRAQIQWRPAGQGTGYRTLATVTTSGWSQIVRAVVRLPGAGVLRVRWRAPSGQVQYSRSAPVRAG